MNTIPMVIVLDDNAEDLEMVDIQLRKFGYATLAKRDPASILRRLYTGRERGTNRPILTNNYPTLAVLDYEMHHAPDSSRRVEELLQFLWENYPNCRVIMYSSVLGRSDVRDRINTAHPLALLEDKRPAVDALVQRIHRAVGVRAGDLSIEGSSVRFTNREDPTKSRVFGHHVRYNLVMRYPDPVVLWSLPDQKMARRFRAELAEIGSCMTVVADIARSHRYRLVRGDQIADRPAGDE